MRRDKAETKTASPRGAAASLRHATITDIAREAGVSIATVSRVLADSGYPVRKALRQRVLEVAKRLDYRPNPFGRMLKGGASRQIGVIVPSIANPFYAQLVSEVERHCFAAGYSPIICSSYNSPQLECEHLDMLQRHQVAGAIISRISPERDFLDTLAKLPMPRVLFDQCCEGYDGSGVFFDFRRGGYLAARHLLDLGHRRIAFVSPPLERASRRLVFLGYRDALREAGIRSNPKLTVIAPEGTHPDAGMQDYHNGRLLGAMLLAAGRLPDAILAVNDIIAIGLMNILQERGVEVPGAVSVVGFDDIAFSAMVTPALTTVRQSTAQTARSAADILFRQIQDPVRPPIRTVLEPKLVERASVRRWNGTAQKTRRRDMANPHLSRNPMAPDMPA